MQFTFHIVRFVFFSIRPGWPERRGIYVHVSRIINVAILGNSIHPTQILSRAGW